MNAHLARDSFERVGFCSSLPVFPSRPANRTLYARSDEGYADRFRRYAARWKREIRTCSLVETMEELPEFRAIVTMGPAVLPLIEEDLKDEPSFIFLAIPLILRIDPTPPELSGDINAIANFWIEWLEQNPVD